MNEMNDRPVVLLDCSYLGYRSKFALSGTDLSYGELQTNVMFGFLMTLQYLSTYLKTNQFIFLWDSKKSYRRNLFPGYGKDRRKSKAEKTEEEKLEHELAMRQFNLLRARVLPGMGFRNVFRQAGLEADDLIAWWASELVLSDVVIVSADKDLYQLLRHNVRQFAFPHKWMTEKKMWEEYGLGPERWAMVKAVGGCTSDSVPGVSGVGEKTAIKYLKGELSPASKTYSKIKQSRKQINLYHRLTKIPYPKTKPMEWNSDALQWEKMAKVFRRYGMKSFLQPKQKTAWQNFIQGEFHDEKKSSAQKAGRATGKSGFRPRPRKTRKRA